MKAWKSAEQREGGQGQRRGGGGVGSGPGEGVFPATRDWGLRCTELAAGSFPQQDQASSEDGDPRGLTHSPGLTLGAE